MDIVNINFRFSDMPAEHRMSFRAQPKKVLLPVGTKLYRFVTPGQNYLLSPFWIAHDSYSEIYGMSQKTQVGMVKVARARLAVMKEWSEKMDHICILRLLKPVYVWEGQTKYQPMSKKQSNILWIGGLNQVYVPNLVEPGAHWSSFAEIIYFGKVED